jgi:uncharacterized protein YbaR (Trm112 family)
MTETDPKRDANAAVVEEPDPKLLELLVCPLTKGPLSYSRETRELISAKANLAFPIRNGVPLMTTDAARSLDEPPSATG